ncbi:hypothetical protein C8R43DRAFT_1005036 [Mycena crocata]|nr:hypothetical protein C8R43DRAFT_1005036 [Mycena crocata]
MSLNKITIERNQRTLLDLVAQPGNDVCADCKVKNPRWASHSLGIFICVSCASIHRKIGTHVTKVKSLTMDSWTREQTENMRQNGNLKSNHFYNPNEARHPPPPNLMDGERDSEMEQFIRSKYEYKSFIDRSAIVASKLGPSRSASSVSPRPPPEPTYAPAKPPSAPSVRSTTLPAPPVIRSLTQPPPALPQQPQFQPPPQRPQFNPQPQQQQQQQQQQQPQGGVWNDLISLQAPASSSSLPLQFQASQGFGQQQQPMSMNAGMAGYQPQMTMSANPYQSQFTPNPYSQSQFTPSFSSPTPSFSSPAFAASPAPLYNPQPQPFAPQQQQQLFQGQPIQSPVGFQPSTTPTFGNNQMLGGNHFGTPSPQPSMSGSPQPPFMSSSPQPQGQFQPQQQGQFQPQQGQFMGLSPQPPFQQQQQYGGGGGMQMQQGQQQQWMGGPGMGYVSQQQPGQWGGM